MFLSDKPLAYFVKTVYICVKYDFTEVTALK